MQNEELLFETIECGIGIIEYVEPDNLQLQQLMEALAENIKTNGSAETLKLLTQNK